MTPNNSPTNYANSHEKNMYRNTIKNYTDRIFAKRIIRVNPVFCEFNKNVKISVYSCNSWLKILVLIFSFFYNVASAQEAIPLYNCITQAVENNYTIKIQRNQEAIASNNVTVSPFLPSLVASGRQNQTSNQNKISYADTGETISYNLTTDNLSAGVAFNWRLFDGLAMFADYNRQRELLSVAKQESELAIELLIANVCNVYYNIIVLENRLTAAKYTLSLSQERYMQATAMYTLGSSSGLDLRQAKIDLNADSSKLMRQEEELRNAYIRLNTLMNAPLDKFAYVQDSIALLPKMEREKLNSRTLQYNSTLLAARIGKNISELDLKNARSTWFPTLDFNAGYNYSWADNPSLSITNNQVNGLNWGFSLSWTLFDRLETNRKVKNAKLELKGSELNYQLIENEIMSDLALLYNTYENNLLMITFETESAETAQQTLDAAMARYKLGNLSGIEFREYQRNYLEAVDRKMLALYQAKLSEVNLRLMSGELVVGTDTIAL